MSAEIVELDVITRLDLPADRILRRAAEADLAFAIVVGETPDGELYFASSKPGGPEVLWQLERAKLALLKMGGALPD